MTSGIGDRFQAETKYSPGKLPGGYLDWREKPEPYKTYPGALRIQLESPATEGGNPIWEVVQRRRSVRHFRNSPLSSSELSRLLWASQGVTGAEAGYKLRAAPSAGALYPVETYLSVQNIDGIDPGIYHYDVRGHSLECLRTGDMGPALAEAALEQGFLAASAVVLAWTAVFARSKWKYRERAYRYIYLDAGHIAQNVALAAVALGLGSCQIGALYDDEINEVLGVDGKDEGIIYMTAVGRPALPETLT